MSIDFFDTKIKKVAVITAFILILAYGFLIRVAGIAEHPYWMDEGYTINAVLSYAEGNMDGIKAVLDSGATYECFLYCYPTALIANNFGFTSFNYRILSVIFGVLTVIVIFLVAKELFNAKVALLSAFLTNFAYFQIAWSAQARWYTMFTTFTWLSVLFFVKAIKNQKNRKRLIINSALTAIFLILTVMSHSIGILIPILFGVYLIWEQIKKKKTSLQKTSFKTSLTSSLKTTSLIILALATFSLILNFILGQNLLFNFISRITFNFNIPYYASFLLREYWVLLFFVFYAMVSNKKYVSLLSVLFFGYLIPLSSMTTIVHYRYVFHVTPVLIILGVVGLFEILKLITFNKKLFVSLFFGIFIVLFFVSGTGILIPQERYWLETDDPSKLGPRPSYAYTPQPDWNSAYAFIKEEIQENDLIISSHPHFNKIFLNQPGYWIQYDYLGIDGRTQWSQDGREFYVGAIIINDLDELIEITSTQNGFIIFDYMSIDGRIDLEITQFIVDNLELMYFKEDNSYSMIWVYRF